MSEIGGRIPVRSDLVFTDWECASPDELFCRLAGELVPRGFVDEGWLDAIAERERVYPTGLAMERAGIALPHVDADHIKIPYIAVVRPVHPVPFQGMGGVGGTICVRLVVNFGVAASGEGVCALASLLRAFSDASLLDGLIAQDGPNGIALLLSRALSC